MNCLRTVVASLKTTAVDVIVSMVNLELALIRICPRGTCPSYGTFLKNMIKYSAVKEDNNTYENSHAIIIKAQIL